MPRRRYSSADTRRRRVHGLDRGPCRLVRAWVAAALADELASASEEVFEDARDGESDVDSDDNW